MEQIQGNQVRLYVTMAHIDSYEIRSTFYELNVSRLQKIEQSQSSSYFPGIICRMALPSAIVALWKAQCHIYSNRSKNPFLEELTSNHFL